LGRNMALCVPKLTGFTYRYVVTCSISPTIATILLHHGRPSAGLRAARTALRAPPAHDEAVEKEEDHRADEPADEARAHSGAIPPDGLTEIRRDERADDTQDGCEDESLGFIVAGHHELGDDSGEEANNDRPDNAHIVLLPGSDGPTQTS